MGRRKSPLLFGRISIRPHHEEEEDPPMQDEESLWGWEEVDITHPRTPVSAPRTGLGVDTPPATQPSTPAKSQPPTPSPLWDIEICTPVQMAKRHRATSPTVTPQRTIVAPRMPGSTHRTPTTGGALSTGGGGFEGGRISPLRKVANTVH